MKDNILIWWIDDETDRLTPAAKRAIEEPRHPALEGRSAILDVKQVKTDEAIRDVIIALASSGKSHPDLVVTDQMLNVDSQDGVVQRGSSLAVTLRAQVPSVPVIGVTGCDPSQVAALQKDQFIDLLSRDAVHTGDGIPDLYAIADGFATVVKSLRDLKKTALHRKILLRLLSAPSEDAELLFACIPGDFKRAWDAETAHSFARWVWHTLIGRPGFLYDDLEIATLIGLNPKGLGVIEQQLKGCEYAGVFCTSSRRRWWVSKVRARVRELTNAPAATPLQLLGRELTFEKQHFSKCYGVGETDTIAEVIAYRDDLCDPRRRVQARIEDTVPVETDTAPLGFEQRRVYRKID